MSIFNLLEPGHWQPSPLAAGPFNGLQGGAIAGLLTAELEALAADKGWGSAISVTTWFLRPTPVATLRTRATSVIEGGRVNVVDNMLYVEGEAALAQQRVSPSSANARSHFRIFRWRRCRRSIPLACRCVVRRPPTANHGLWMRWRRAGTTAWSGSG